MKYYYFIFFSLLFISIFSFENEIENGVYLIKNLEGNLNLKVINSTLYFSSKENKNQFDNFRFYKKEIKKNNEYESYEENSEIYYYIEEKNSRKKLYFDEERESVFASETINKEDNDKFLWEIKITKNRNNLIYYEIKSKTRNKFISYKETKKDFTKAYCESSWNSLAYERKTKLLIIKLYKENNNINKESRILESEPIDVVIKYIDLNDTSLERIGVEQISKDKQNNELKYSLRSIIQNIPWVRKIFIIMPNEKIPFLKEKEEIKDKIVYIKDNQLLNFESSSPPSFQFNLHKLKKFGLSENFILMDDDYFIAQPLSKSDFFYEEKGQIYPLLIATEYFEIDEEELKSQYMKYISNINDINYHSKDGFSFRRISTLLFLYKIFDNKDNDNPLIEVGFTHNALPLKISDVEEVHDLIEDKYQYSQYCLKGNKRNIRTLQPQILFMSYIRNKYNRPVKEMSWKYYDLSDIREVNLDSKLFVINVEDKEYYPLRFKTEEEVLSSLFPNPTKYEKIYNNKDEKKESKSEENNNEPKKDNTDNISDLNEIFNRIKNINKIDDDNKNDKQESEYKKEEKKEERKEEQKEERKEEQKEEKKEEQKIEQIIDKKEDKKIEENEKEFQRPNIEEEKEKGKKEISNEINNNNNDVINEKIIQEIKQEIKNQKSELDKK